MLLLEDMVVETEREGGGGGELEVSLGLACNVPEELWLHKVDAPCHGSAEGRELKEREQEGLEAGMLGEAGDGSGSCQSGKGAWKEGWPGIVDIGKGGD